ncbi:IS1 family transposase [Shigella sonnei]
MVGGGWDGGWGVVGVGGGGVACAKSVELHDKVIGHYLNIKHYQ